MIRPTSDYFLFHFMNDISNGFFVQKNKGKIIIANASMNPDDQGNPARWGKVVAVGPMVNDFKADDIVLIEPGKWTIGFDYEGTRYWKSQEQFVMAIGEDENVTYDFK